MNIFIELKPALSVEQHNSFRTKDLKWKEDIKMMDDTFHSSQNFHAKSIACYFSN